MLCLTAVLPAKADCLPATVGIAGWWPGEGNANDIAGTNDGSLQGGASATAAGWVGTAFGFDGTNGYVQIPDSPALRPTNLTIEAWVRFSSLDSAGNAPAGQQYIVFKQNSRSSFFEGYNLAKLRTANGDVLAFIVSSAAGELAQLQSATVVATGVWYHVAGVRGSNFSQLYINGQLESQTTVNFAQDYGNYPLLFGTSGQAFWDRKFKGSLDEVSLYNRALSAEEVAAIYITGSAWKCRGLSVTTQPQSQSVVAGNNAILTVAAVGAMPLSYQWRFNGTDLPGATATSLTLTGVQPANAGSYTVVVTNSAASVTSAVAVVTVLVPPAITVEPASQSVVAGHSPTLNVTATGTPPPGYQWRFNGVGLPGATRNSLTLTNVQPANAGSYTVVVTNSAGSLTSAVAVLTVLVPPTINLPPASQSVVAGNSVTFTVAADGTPPLSYQWQFNGAYLPGATSTSLTLTGAQPANAGSYTAVVTNSAASVTSAVAVLTVLVPPTIVLPPASQDVVAGEGVTFNVTATGTAPLAYQWRKDGTDLADGGNLSGANGTALALVNVQTNDAGDYQVVVTNSVGSVTSTVASLTVVPPFHPAFQSAGAVVLVNSQSARYLDFQHFIQPYLDNFGFPYTVLDITTNAPSESISNCAVIIIGHSQLDTNRTFLDAAVQANLSLAVSNGTGLVNFDNDLHSEGNPRYQFVQDLFGFTYGPDSAASGVSLPPTEPSGQMHYIAARHPTNDIVAFRSGVTLPGITAPSNVTPLALGGGQPLLAVARCGQGRAVQWGSYDWMVSPVLGPIGGLDDLVWRGVVWAARKPVVMRGLPSFVTMRVDDVTGPFPWLHAANAVGFKPFVTLFYMNVSEASAADLGALTTGGQATASIHSIDGNTTFFYFNHETGQPWPDNVQSNNFYLGTQWHLSHGIPISKVCATHYSEIGLNCFAGLKAWGMEYVPIEVVPGTIEYGTPPAPWVINGPYRLYETPQPGQVHLPTYYADWLVVPGHPEFDGRFFNIYSEIRDVGTCGEWCPDNDLAGSTSRATQMAKRALDSHVMATLFTHEWYISPISATNWLAILEGITNNLASYDPIYVTLDYASQYVRATRTSRLLSSAFDPGSGQVRANFSGQTDLDTRVYVFAGPDDAITAGFGNVPAFSMSSKKTVTVSGPPAIIKPPSSQTNYAGTAAVFSVEAGGAWPLSYQWYRNGTNALSDGGRVSGACSATLTISDAQTGDAGSYAVALTNLAGSVASSAASLTVIIAPRFTSITLLPDHNPLLSLDAAANVTCRIDVSTNLVSWTGLTNIADPNGRLQFVDSGATNFSQRFYRAVSAP